MKQLLLLVLAFILISLNEKSIAQVNNTSVLNENKECTEKYKEIEKVSLKSAANSTPSNMSLGDDVVLFMEDFEGSSLNFTTIDANADSSTWSLYSESGSGIDVAYEGDKGAGSYSGYIASDDYLVSSEIVLPAEGKIIFSFYARSRDALYKEDFNVKLSTTGKAIDDFSITLDEIRSKSAEWELLEYNLDAFAGDTVYLAFHSISNDKWELYIDNVLIIVAENNLTADFTSEKPYGQAPSDIQFTDISSGAITSWRWDFGDQTTSTDQNPLHRYSSPGYYSVTLEVSNGPFSDSKTAQNFVTIIDDYSTYNWTSLNVPNNNGNYLEVYFFDDNNGFLYQYDQSHYLLKTSDGGVSWTEVSTPEQSFIYEIDFADSKNGYIRTDGNFIFKSVDGGDSWTKIEIPNTFYYNKAIDMEVISSGTVILTLDNSNNDVIKTVDAGVNWEVLEVDAIIPKYLSFVNDSVGFILDQNYDEPIKLLKTTNGGESWNMIASFGDGTQHAKGIDFYSEEIGFIYGSGFKGNDMVTYIWKITEGGTTFTLHERTGFEISDLEYLTPDFLFFSGNDRLSINNPQIITLNFEDSNNAPVWDVGSDDEVHALFFVSPTKAFAGGSQNPYVFAKHITGLETVELNLLNVYPNPTNNKLNIQCSNLNSEASIELINSNGQVIYNSEITSHQLKVIDVKDYSPGVYAVRILSDDKTEIKKVIIQ
ncbi:MAG: T9SS type A sorting domain-containing protein [Draconibacterium sp.]|nr:T9SS type A sorting domain-containing protein [Draconibacterium sp.]